MMQRKGKQWGEDDAPLLFMDKLDLTFTIKGTPVPKGRPRVTKTGRAYTPKRTRDYEARVKAHALKARAMARQKKAVGQVAVDIVVRGANPRADIDNIAKAALDACNDVLWVDDEQVVDLRVRRAEGEPGITMKARVI